VVVVAVILTAAAVLAAAVVWWSGATLAGGGAELARIELQPLAGSFVSATAFGPDGSRIPLVVRNGRLMPRSLLRQGERVTVEVVVRRPTWLGWALGGKNRTERLSLRTPVSRITGRWLIVSSHSPLRVRFAGPVSKVAYRASDGTHSIAVGGRRLVSLGPHTGTGTVEISSAARRWERVGSPVRVTWFPVTHLPAALVSPAANRVVSPLAQVRLTFARPVTDVVGSRRPQFSPSVPGRWRTTDSHTISFTPAGLGFPLAAKLRLELPRTVALGDGAANTQLSTINWTVAAGSVLRLQQLLADTGYLPVTWQPDGDPVARRQLAEINAAVTPPSGTFSWRYPNTPSQLQQLWSPGQPNQITRGAVMMFQHDHGLVVDALAGPQVWRALLTDAIAGKKRGDGYSYVYVHRALPQLLTLWHNGQTVLTSPGNTGVPAAPTQPGTFPVFEHIPVGTMSGTNPDGSHYNDPGIRWISYFHGGDALHAFTRASFGTPQSLGCVELPLASAAAVWPYTPIGTLVTIES
jgi:peptidoglycan hydrolase-like protein with peptidoglycan-binding domain